MQLKGDHSNETRSPETIQLERILPLDHRSFDVLERIGRSRALEVRGDVYVMSGKRKGYAILRRGKHQGKS